MHIKYLFLSLALLSAAVSPCAAAPTDPRTIHRVLILGDSITRHPNAPEIGWTSDWGMAASARDKDYVHLFLAQLNKARGTPLKDADVLIFSKGGGKTTDKVPFANELAAFHADLALVQLGENDHEIAPEAFGQAYETLLAAIRAGNPNVRILCVGVWGLYPSEDHVKDKVIRAACEKYGATFADLGAAYADENNRAGAEHRFTNTAVNWHPGDRGMAAYADAFWQAFAKSPSAPTLSSAEMKKAATEAGRLTYKVRETWGEQPELTWSPQVPVVQDNGHNMARITSTDGKDATYGTRLDVRQLSGRSVHLTTRVRAENVSEKPNNWNGVKLILAIHTADGKVDYPGYEFPTGTFDWTDVELNVAIPTNATIVDLGIGLEKVSGTVWYGAIEISAK